MLLDGMQIVNLNSESAATMNKVIKYIQQDARSLYNL